MVEVYRHDVIVVGGGAAGIRAAIAAVEADPKVSVAMVSKVYPMRSHTVSAEGGAAAYVPGSEDSLEKHFYDTVKGSDFLADQDCAEYFVEHATEELTLLEHWGCPWSRNEDGSVATRPFGGMTVPRTWYAADKVGFHMLHSLFQHSMRFDRIVRYDENFVTKLLVDDGACRGVVAIDIRSGAIRLFLGRAVILATGGAGKCFPFTTNGTIKTGDGMSLAYRAGVPLKDMEFLQYHPTGLPGTGILITEASRGEGGYVLNAEGERFLVTRDYGVGQKAELGPRDMISRAEILEIEAGRGLKGPYGEYVLLDLRHLGEAKIMVKLPVRAGAREDLHRCRPGPRADPDPPGRALHDGRRRHRHPRRHARFPASTRLARSPASSMNGANRLGSNSLTECLVFGARAGVESVAFAKGSSDGNEARLRSEAETEGARLEALRGRKKGGEKIAQIRREMQLSMERGCGVYRSQEGDEPGGRGAGAAEGPLRRSGARRHLARSSTPRSCRRSNSATCSTSRKPSRSPRPRARSRAAPTPVATTRTATTPSTCITRWSSSRRRDRAWTRSP